MDETNTTQPGRQPEKQRGRRLQELLARLPLPGADGSIAQLDGADSPANDIDLLRVRMGGRDFLLPASEVAEIVRPMPLTPVPMAPDHLLGVGNVHGQIVCVLEPGRLMSLPEKAAPDGAATRYVVLRHARMRVALRVDGVPAIHRVDASELEAMQASDSAVHGVRGWLEVEGVRYDMLDAGALLQD